MKLTTEHPRPICVGTGLIALDMVINGDSKLQPKFWAGGSCGNVITILSYLGWGSYALARFKDDHIAAEVIQDMEKWGVQTHLIRRDSDGSTPVVVERIVIDQNGTPRHNFQTSCPYCGSKLPKYKPLLIRQTTDIVEKMPKPQVFYFDRVIGSAIRLAKRSKELGALVVFEPSSVKDKDQFLESLKVADIVKYSHEKLRQVRDLMSLVSIPLEIETLGSAGLRYRLGNHRKADGKWTVLEAYPVKNLKDAAGAGDWCSAGVIYSLGSGGAKSFRKAKAEDIKMALKLGQSLAALNCHYEGARGVMYSISKEGFAELVCCIQNGINPSKFMEDNEMEETQQARIHICTLDLCIQNQQAQKSL